MEEREKKAVHISWEEAYRAEVGRDKARQMRCRSIPPTQIEVIVGKLITALSKFNGSAPHLFSLMFSHRHRLSSDNEKMAFSANAGGLEDRSPKTSVSHYPLRSTIAITAGFILLGAIGMLSYSHYNESDLPDPAGKWNHTTHISQRDSSEAKVPESSTTHLVGPYRASKTYQSAEADGRENSSKTAPGFSENLEVVDNSFVRDQPEPDATIIATLRPGTQVRVESKTGDYLRVRSLSDADVIGYVHEEDAFFRARWIRDGDLNLAEQESLQEIISGMVGHTWDREKDSADSLIVHEKLASTESPIVNNRS